MYTVSMARQPGQVQLREDVGRTVRTSRRGVGWSQRELSRRSGVPQAQICRIERGRVRDLRIGEIDGLFVALGVRYWLGIEPPILTPRPADIVHARCSTHVTRRLLARGWKVEREVEVGGDRSRGWIDVLAVQPATGALLVIEIKTEIHDIGAIERTINWYRREATVAARRLRWPVTSVYAALLVLESGVNDALLLSSAAVFRAAFPGRASELRDVIAGVGAAGRAAVAEQRFVAMIDPRSRRADWLHATRSDGRRTAAPYVDYVDAVRRLSARPQKRP